MQFINRRGEVYFAYQGTTKTGKPKYFAPKKQTSPNATRVAELPSDFEFFENPVNATVVVRRRKESELTVAERNQLSRLALELCDVDCEVVIDGNSLVVYACPAIEINTSMEEMMPRIGKSLQRCAKLEPGFKFTLTSLEDRTFSTERYCYRGSVDDWWQLHSLPDTLASAAAKYLPHLGRESFFELC